MAILETSYMKRIKNILFYSWWINFWVILLAIVMIWERPMLRFIGPLAFIAFIGYAVYVMLVTRPNINPNTEETKNLTPGTPSGVDDSDKT